MVGYKDKTWCFEDTCKNRDDCWRYFTEKDKTDAISWWGGKNFPIACFTERPDCYVEDIEN